MAGSASLPGNVSIFVLLIFLIGLAITICWVFSEVPTLSEDPLRLMLFAVIACGCVILFIAMLSRQCIRFDIDRATFVVLLFMLFSMFTATIDLCISSSLLHFTHLGNFYLVRGEEYFSAPAGTMCLVWDATVHLVLQAIVVRNLLQQRPYAHYLLVWAGSVVASMPPLLIGAATGAFASRIHASTALNIPWVFVPVAIGAQAFRVLNATSTRDSSQKSQKSNSKKTSKVNEISWGLVGLHVVTIVVYTLRMLAVLRSPTAPAVWWKSVEPVLIADNEPSGFIAVQGLMGFFMFVPWHAYAIFHIFTGTSPTIYGWSMLFLGSELQHAALHVFASLFVVTSNGFALAKFVPSDTTSLAWFAIGNACIVLASLSQSRSRPKVKPA